MISTDHQIMSAVFITFPGNCKEALTYYQSCFGGKLDFEIFDKQLPGYADLPVISGSLVADDITIHGSDLVHNEGRIVGNHMAIALQCADVNVRKEFIEKLDYNKKDIPARNYNEKLIEVIDAFDVRWVLYV